MFETLSAVLPVLPPPPFFRPHPALPTGETPMTCAAYYGHTDVIRELIENGADVNLVRMDGTSPLWLAANAPDEGGEAAALELLSNGAKADIVGSRGGTALHGAAFHGREKLAASLLAAGCPVNAVNSKTSYTALHTAAETKHPKARAVRVSCEGFL